MLPDFIPIENTGMPIITALVLFFLCTSLYYGGKYLVEKNRQQDNRLNKHADILAEIQGDSKETKAIVERVETTVNDTLKSVLDTNATVVKRLLKD